MTQPQRNPTALEGMSAIFVLILLWMGFATLIRALWNLFEAWVGTMSFGVALLMALLIAILTGSIRVTRSKREDE